MAFRFIDSAGATVEGKAACIQARRGFFGAFPDYRNVFDDVRSDATGAVQVRGRSECSAPGRWLGLPAGVRWSRMGSSSSGR